MCKSLEMINQNGEIKVSSRVIALDFEKEHWTVVRSIENLTQQNCDVKNMFLETKYNHKGNEYTEYFMNRDGFSLLVMGFTGSEALKWKLKYIEAFNNMEKQLIQQVPKLSKELQAIFVLDERTVKIENEVKQLKDDMPLFQCDCKEIQATVRKKGIKILGGKKSNAYKNNSLRGKVYSDMQSQLKREFGINRYESIKRINFDKAIEIINNYNVPLILQDEITLLNNKIKIEVK